MDMLVKPPPVLADMRTVLRGLRNTAQSALQAGEYYRLDRLDSFAYLNKMPKWGRVIASYLQSLRERGEPIVFVDICGRTFLRQAQVNYSFSLQPTATRWHPEGTTPIQGDIFSRHDFPRFLELIESRGHRPAWVTFEPVAGLQSYYLPRSMRLADLHHAVVFRRLAQHLESMIRLLRPGGYIFLGPAFQFMYLKEFLMRVPRDRYAACTWAREFCREHRCSIQIDSGIYGPHWLIRKWLR